MSDWIEFDNKIIGCKHKCFSLQSGYADDKVVSLKFEISFSRKMDHAGFDLRIELFKIYLYFSIYDDRHWNEEENKWEE
jgi:hypothetical protein